MADTKDNIKVEMIDIDKIIPYNENPKEHKKEQINKIASSIKNYGFNVPIIIDKKNEIIAGHGRYFASKKLELKEIPVIKRVDLNDAQVRAYRIADNKVAESDWDMELLAIEFEKLEYEDDINLLDTGFNLDEIDGIMSDLPEIVDNSNEKSTRDKRMMQAGKTNLVISIGTFSSVLDYDLVSAVIEKIKNKFGDEEDEALERFANWFINT